MKRSAVTQEYDLSSDCTLYHEIPRSTIEKRARSGTPPVFAGPLVFESDGVTLGRAVVDTQDSTMPGVHRLTAPQPAPFVKLWAPQFEASRFIPVRLDALLLAINAKCIFIFDTRVSTSEHLLGDRKALGQLLSLSGIQRFGIFCSRVPLTPVLAGLAIPYVQDETKTLAALCNFHDYMGPAAVLAKDGQVVATCMLGRSFADVAETIEAWSLA